MKNKTLFAFSFMLSLVASFSFVFTFGFPLKTLPKLKKHHKTLQKIQEIPLRAQKQNYTLTYGRATAPHHILNFFDIGCIHCQTFYRTIWPTIKEQFVKTGKLRFTFAPYPVHTETVLFMTCVQQLEVTQQQILFEALMEQDVDPNLVIKVCMTALRKPVPSLSSEALKETLLLTKQHQFEALPVMFWNGQKLTDEQQEDILQFLQENLR